MAGWKFRFWKDVFGQSGGYFYKQRFLGGKKGDFINRTDEYMETIPFILLDIHLPQRC